MKRLHEREFPSSAEEGWPRDQEKIRRLLIRAAGVVLFKFQNEIVLILTSTHPVSA